MPTVVVKSCGDEAAGACSSALRQRTENGHERRARGDERRSGDSSGERRRAWRRPASEGRCAGSGHGESLSSSQAARLLALLLLSPECGGGGAGGAGGGECEGGGGARRRCEARVRLQSREHLLVGAVV